MTQKQTGAVRTKHVWVLNHYARGPSESGGTRHFHLAQKLVPLGWVATVFTASVNRDDIRQTVARNEGYRDEQIEGVSFRRIRTPAYQGNGIGRIKNMLAYFGRMLLPRYTRGIPDPEVVVGSSVHPFAAVAAALLARRHRVPFVFEVRDLWPQTLIEMGRLREGSAVTWLMRRLELWLYRSADRIVVLLPKAVEYIAPLGIPEDRVNWIPNGVDLTLYSRNRPPRGPSCQPFTFMYFGAHGQANGLETLIEAMGILKRRGRADAVQLRMIGGGGLKPTLIEMSQQLGLSNISFESRVEKREIPNLAAQADAFVITVRALPGLYRYGISMNKLFDYLAAGRPIVISLSAANNPVAEAGAGLTAEPDDPVSLADAMEKLVALPAEERSAMGESARKYVSENHRFEVLAKRFADILDDVVAERSRESRALGPRFWR
ncbi:glycosyltransferase family 4 protein [Thioalkalivibrio paradoxus]|uniref:Glycosyl transferase n=1 Tax=Thioalkalivibrio paradoxus ARh 1 TaxID=713585 RepID=W0DKU1_9GAMM|nr:glycosyltransferase family 4 protein [Thioalkalivibrio paradoxus]AHE97852.1 glycosyl transferase [Thioalkalivibrio paradoxus ARh 1]